MSNETKFTGGEWKINFTGPHWNNPDLRNIEITYSDIGECVCDTVYDVNDAHLIKTAPKLYQMLDTVRQVLSGDSEYNADEISVDYIKKLLAEARGE